MRRLQLSRDERRAAILAAAVDHANKHGLAFCDFHSVAERVPVPTTPRLIRYHFGRKRNLWLAIVKHPAATARLTQEAKQIGLI